MVFATACAKAGDVFGATGWAATISVSVVALVIGAVVCTFLWRAL
jgi:uncharacterized membrane protein (Fun14 family)